MLSSVFSHNDSRSAVVAMLGAVALVTGCGSSSSGGGGSVSTEESAALAVVTGPGAARQSRQSLPEEQTFEPADGGTSSSGVSAMGSTVTCTESNLPTSGTGSETVFGQTVTTTTVTYNNYSFTCSNGASATVDGGLEAGDDGSRFYAEFGDPDVADGPFVATTQVPQASDMSFNMRALVRVCDGCGGTDSGTYTVNGGVDPDFQAEFFMDAEMRIDPLDAIFRFGDSPAAPMELRVWNPGANETVALDGRIGLEQGSSPCGYDWVLDTQTPVKYQNENPQDGTVLVSDPDTGASHTVIVNSGQITVDGQVITEQRRQEIANNCGFEEQA